MVLFKHSFKGIYKTLVNSIPSKPPNNNPCPIILDYSKFNKLSCDMKMEIISRTSLRTLDAIRCTNKELNNLSYDSYLLDLYNQRNNNKVVSGLMVQNINNFIKDFKPLPGTTSLELGFLSKGTYQIVASSEQGLLVLGHPQRTPWSYKVYKPTTRQICDLQPSPRTMYKTKMLAIVVSSSKPLCYKIIRLSRPDSSYVSLGGAYSCEIFDSMMNAWRLLKDLVILPCDVDVLTDDPPITAIGSVYVLLTNNHVLKIDSYINKWTTFPSPNLSHCVDQEKIFKLVKYEGKLGFACKPLKSTSFWEIWLLKADGSWDDKAYVLDDHKDQDTGQRMSLFKSLYDSDTMDSNLPNEDGDNTDDNGQLINRRRAHLKFVFRSDFERIDPIYKWGVKLNNFRTLQP